MAVLLDSAIDARAYAGLQAAALRQGLQGEVVALWVDSAGRTCCIAPPQQRPFFELMQYSQLRAQANGTLQIC